MVSRENFILLKYPTVLSACFCLFAHSSTGHAWLNHQSRLRRMSQWLPRKPLPHRRSRHPQAAVQRRWRPFASHCQWLQTDPADPLLTRQPQVQHQHPPSHSASRCRWQVLDRMARRRCQPSARRPQHQPSSRLVSSCHPPTGLDPAPRHCRRPRHPSGCLLNQLLFKLPTAYRQPLRRHSAFSCRPLGPRVTDQVMPRCPRHLTSAYQLLNHLLRQHLRPRQPSPPQPLVLAHLQSLLRWPSLHLQKQKPSLCNYQPTSCRRLLGRDCLLEKDLSMWTSGSGVDFCAIQSNNSGSWWLYLTTIYRPLS